MHMSLGAQQELHCFMMQIISGICAAFQFMNSAQDYEILCGV